MRGGVDISGHSHIPLSSNVNRFLEESMLIHILISYKFRIGWKYFGRMVVGKRDKKYIDKKYVDKKYIDKLLQPKGGGTQQK